MAAVASDLTYCPCNIHKKEKSLYFYTPPRREEIDFCFYVFCVCFFPPEAPKNYYWHVIVSYCIMKSFLRPHWTQRCEVKWMTSENQSLLLFLLQEVKLIHILCLNSVKGRVLQRKTHEKGRMVLVNRRVVE